MLADLARAPIAGVDDRGAAVRDRRGDRGRPRPPTTARRWRALAGRRARLDPDTVDVAGQLGRGAAGGRRGGRRGRGGDDRPRAQRVRAGPAARAPRRARSGDGLLPAQQRRHRRRGGAARGRRARADRRLGRAPRQRHAGHLRGARTTCSTCRCTSTRSIRAPAPRDEVGVGAGRGATVNCPLPGGQGDADYGVVFHDLFLPAARAFAPDLIIVSAGFDAHARDPLADMRVTERGFAAMASRAGAARRRDLRRQAGADAGGRLRPAGAGGVGARDAGGADRTPRRASRAGAGRGDAGRRSRRRARRWRAAGRAVPKSEPE